MKYAFLFLIIWLFSSQSSHAGDERLERSTLATTVVEQKTFTSAKTGKVYVSIESGAHHGFAPYLLSVRLECLNRGRQIPEWSSAITRAICGYEKKGIHIDEKSGEIEVGYFVPNLQAFDKERLRLGGKDPAAVCMKQRQVLKARLVDLCSPGKKLE